MRLFDFNKRIAVALAVCAVALSWGCARNSPTGPTPTGQLAVDGAVAFGAASTPSSVTWGCFAALSNGFGAPAGCAPRMVSQALVAASDAPSSPFNLQRQVQGTTVVLSWSAPAGGDAPTSYVVEAGSSSGASNITTFDTGNAATTLTVTDVPPGQYFVRVRGRNASGAGPVSNEVILQVGPPSQPPTGTPPPGTCAASGPNGAPQELIGAAIGTTVAIRWQSPAGCNPDGYLIVVGSTPGANDVARVPVGPFARSYSVSGILPGTYYVFVRALNGTVSGPASNTVAITVQSAAPQGTTTWVGLAANGEGFSSPNDEDCGAIAGDLTLTLVQSGSSVTGIVTLVVRSAATCAPLVGYFDTSSVSGTATGSLASGSGSLTLVVDDGDDSVLTATFANGVLTGTTTGEDGTATVTLRRQ